MRVALAVVALLVLVPSVTRGEELCDPAYQDCRAKLIAYIRAERVGIDLAFNLFEDTELADILVSRHPAIRIRVIVEPRRNSTNPLNAVVIDKLRAAGIPVRQKVGGGIFHWKMFHFAGQQVVEFAATNFAIDYLRPRVPYTDCYVDPLYFTTDLALVRSFQTRYDDLWTNTTDFGNLANVTTLARAYPTSPVVADLNFVPQENFLTRSKPLYDAETRQIDVVMYKITESGHADRMLKARGRGVPVRLITEPQHYRSPQNVWHAYNLDRLHAAGVRVRERAHQGFLHQKTTLLYSQGLSIFGSSNWALASNKDQWEHNYFTRKTWFFAWMEAAFNRRWNGAETRAFVPLPPAAPVYTAPANASSGQPTTVVLSWKPGLWAHRADVYLGTSSTPPLYQSGVSVSPGATAVKRLTVSGLTPGRTYYWRIVSKTMAGLSAPGPTWSFGT